MRQLVSTFLMTGLVLLLNACATTQYTDDYRTGTDFSGLKTYSWRAVTVDVGGIDNNFVQSLADDQLRAQGFVPVENNADFMVDMQVFSRVNPGGNTNLGIGIGAGGSNGGIGMSTNKNVGQGKVEGMIVIDITQANSNTLIWRGNAEGIPLINFSLKAEQKLRESFTKLLTPFPPQATVK